MFVKMNFNVPKQNYYGDCNDYRYGFQGQELDNEVKGVGNSLNYKYRMHDSRLGRFFAVDPLTKKYPHYTPYSFSGNKVIAFVELEGLEESKNLKTPGNNELNAMIDINKGIAPFVSNKNEDENGENSQNSLATTQIPNATVSGGAEVNENGEKYVSDLGYQPTADKYNMYVHASGASMVNESDYDDYETFVSDKLLKNFITGTGPENYIFPKNGKISLSMKSAKIVKEALADYVNSNGERTTFRGHFGIKEMFKEGVNIPGFVGSATITIKKLDDGNIEVKIFNITSLSSGALVAKVYQKYIGLKNYDKLGVDPMSLWPQSYVREKDKITPFGNISQTFSFTMEDLLKK